MDNKSTDKVKWIQLGLMSFLAVTVVIMAVVIYHMQTRLDTLGQSHSLNGQSRTSSLVTPQPKPSQPKADQKQDSDLFSKSFDPDSWNPFAEMQQMQKRIDRLFTDSFGRFGQSDKFSDLMKNKDYSPNIDVIEEGDKYVIQMDLPGVEAGNIDVKVNDRDVEISGKRTEDVTNKDKDGHVVRQERIIGSFSRSVELPEAVDAKKMTAKDENGVFTVVLPKKALS